MLPPEPVFLDRDGVLNENVPDYIRTESQWVPLPGALEAAAVLSMSGHPLIVVTNQSAVGRGLMTLEAVARINSLLERRIASLGGRIDAVYLCPHAPWENCRCRKPATGMVEDARADLGLPRGGWLVGDAWSDIGMGAAAGLRTIMVMTGRGAGQMASGCPCGSSSPDFVVEDLNGAARIILQHDGGLPPPCRTEA
ncbi:HAD family hydrolase [Candidatus Fermentibacteria bacterium]|nr:HAD family hydrolase [Candidatus Fermentibacteria bacterium]